MEDIKATLYKDIYNIINKIKKCKSKSLYNILCIELSSLYNLCIELNLDDYPKLEDYSYKNIEIDNNYNYLYEILCNYSYHLRFSRNNLNINEDTYEYHDSFIIKNFFRSERYFYIIEDFLSSYDSNLLHTFHELVRDGRVIEITNDKKSKEEIYTHAYTTLTYGNFKPYIVLKKENCVPDLISLVHELGHASEYINVNRVSNKVCRQREYNCLTEVYSHFLQHLFILYLKKIRFYVDDVNTSNLGYNYTFYHWIKKLNESLEFKKIDTGFIDYVNYTYGIAISYLFVDRYLKDPEKTKKEINEFMVFNGQYKFIDLLNKYELKDDLVDSKILRKYL